MKKVIIGTASAETVEKKSRFIATAFQIRSEAEAVSVLEKTRKQYWDARHNCYAFICGPGSELQRFSDDGEPSGTAGRPILDVLNGAGLTNILVIVTRYFGGILLGTGGLVRAYSGAASAVVSGAEASGVIREISEGSRITFSCDYKDIGRIENILAEKQIAVFDKNYGENVTITAALREDQDSAFRKAALDATNGSITFNAAGSVFFCSHAGHAEIYEF